MPTRTLVAGALACLVAAVSVVAQAPAPAKLDKSAVVGKWQLDEPKSKAAADGNTAGLMKSVTIREDGSFEALYDTKGKWTLAAGKLLVTYENGGFRQKEAAAFDGTHLKFPSPAHATKYCYLVRAK